MSRSQSRLARLSIEFVGRQGLLMALALALLCLPGLSVTARDYSVGSYSELRDAIRNARDGDTIID